ncbi:MAG: hypothetical protein AB1758_27095, partial [Candidatus Eremiobacterota bacterium]
MRGLVATWLKNPIFRKELRIGLRERRFVWLQVAFLGLACLVTGVTLRDLDDARAMFMLTHQGEQLNGLLIFMEVAALLLIAPALSSGSIASERERNNLDLLVVGGASPAQIVAGKLIHCVLVASLLLLAGLPLSVLALTMGGSSFSGLFWQYFVLFWVMVVLLQYGLMISSRERRSGYATTVTYATLAVLVFGGLWLLDVLDFDPSFLAVWFPNPWLRWGMILTNLVYLSLLLFLKTINHLTPRAAYSRWMGTAFLTWYLGNAAALALGLAYLQRYGDPGDTVWASLVTGSLMALGCFLNVPTYPSRRQQALFSRYPGGKPYVWVVLLSLGLAVAAAGPLMEGAMPAPIISLVGLGAFLLVTTASIAHSLRVLFEPRIPFRLLYFLWLGGVCGVAAVGLLFTADRPTAPFWSLVYLSPVYSTMSLTRFHWGTVP